MFHELNWIPIFIDPYISRFSVDYKRQEGSTTDYNISILPTNSEINNLSIFFSNLNFHCPIFYRNKVGDRTFSVRRILNGNEQCADAKNVKFSKKKYILYEFKYEAKTNGGF